MCDFIKSRLNKDNLWNLMFFIVMFTGIAIAFATKIMILSWITIISVIWLVKRKSDITFDKENSEFVINGNKKVKTSGTEFMLLMFGSFGIMAMIGFILDSLKIEDSSILLATMMSLLIFLPSLYCIFRNLPIAVYFKKEAWAVEGNAGACDSSDSWRSRSHHSSISSGYNWRSRSHHSSSSSKHDWRGSSHHSSRNSHNRESLITSPRHRYLSCNIYHR